MFCPKCGVPIPGEGLACPGCGWQLTAVVAARRAAGKKATRRMALASGGIAAGLVAAALLAAGAVLLFNHRGTAAEKWKEKEKEAAGTQRPKSELEALRTELLSLSGKIAGLDEGNPASPAAIAARLGEIERRIAANRDDPLSFRVAALHKSVALQLELAGGGAAAQPPPLPYSPLAPKPSDEYVRGEVAGDMLVGGKIIRAGKGGASTRYGPALLAFEEPARLARELGSLEAPPGWVFAEVVVTAGGNAELVEYQVRLLDDHRRAFPPYLDAEKELRKGKLPAGHAPWRDVLSTKGAALLRLHRVFLLPESSAAKPLLEIKRQGASKMLWVQY